MQNQHFCRAYRITKFISTIVIFFTINNLSAQSISGKISNQNSRGISFASITLQNTDFGISSNIDGYFIMEEIPNGEYLIEVSALGYNKWYKQISINDDRINLDVLLESSSYDLNQVVVTGTMKESFVRSSPVKVDVLTQKFLKKIASSNLMDVINNVNGVQKQVNCGVCGTNDIHINGMEGPYTLVLIDGMPIMSSLSSVYGLNGIPSSLIKQIEIIKGPSSTLYGTEAVAGVINIITKDSYDVSRLELDAFVTSHFEKNINFSIAPKLKNLNTILSGNYFHMNTFLDENGDNFSDIPLTEKINLFNKWSFDRASNKELSFSAKYYSESRSGGLEKYSHLIRGNDSIYGESIYTDRIELIGKYQLPFKENIRLDLSYNYHHQDSYYGNTKYEAFQNIYFSNLVWNKRIGSTHDLILGYTHRYQTFLDRTLANSDEKKFIPALFAQNELSFNDRWKTLLGFRVDHHKDHGYIFSPRLNLKYNPSPNSSLRLNSGTGFRIVNLFTEDHAFLSGTRDVIVKENLDPEKSFNLNINFNHIFSFLTSTGTIDFDLFYTHFSNKIIPDYETNPDYIFYANLKGKSISRGVSMNIQHNFQFPLNLNLGTTYMNVFSIDEENNSSKELFAPDFTAVFAISYKMFDSFSIDWTAKFTGPMLLPTFPEPFKRAEESHFFSLHNLQFKKDFRRNWSAYFAVKNIFDYTQKSPLIDWQNPFGDNFDTSYAYGPLQGRRFLVGMSLNF